MTTASPRRIRPVNIAPSPIVVSHGEGGVIYLKPAERLGDWVLPITQYPAIWASRAPERTFLAERDATGGWRTIRYGETARRMRNLAQALLDRQLSAARPVLIISGNSIDHALLALACMYVGIPYAPISPAYSLQSRDFATFKQIIGRLNPGLVFAERGSVFADALRQVPPGIEIVVSSDPPDGLQTTSLAQLERTVAGPDIDRIAGAVDEHGIAKILFTSGSTGRPKGVINTHRMLSSNQSMIRQSLPFLEEEPPVLCDWAPWNHTAGGNHNFGLVLVNGGTLYIDDGRPTPTQFAATVRNLREVACTAHFAIPRVYELLIPHLRTDAVLRETFFRKLKLLFYAAAGLGQKVWDELREITVEATGEEILIMTGFGSTETAPFALRTGADGAFSGLIGLPAPGLEMKLVPAGSKLEARVRGPNVTPGFFGDEELTKAAFDEEGFYKLGDAMRFADPADPSKGLIFDGRLAEDFKLSTGTWVSVGPLRARFLQQAAGWAQDVVVTGHDRATVGALVFPNLALCRERAGLPADAAPAQVVSHPIVVEHFRRVLAELAAASTGSSTFPARAIVMADPPSLDAREITDKGSINQKSVLSHRTALVDELYATTPSARVLTSS